eukprot:g45576.t1
MDGQTALAGSRSDWTLVEVLIFACGEHEMQEGTAAYKPKTFSAVLAARGLPGWQGSHSLKEWLPKQPGKLLYKASVDGWSSATFHQKCDNMYRQDCCMNSSDCKNQDANEGRILLQMLGHIIDERKKLLVDFEVGGI